MKFEESRREYRYGKLSRETLADSPFEQFEAWMAQATDAGIEDPTAMALSTVDHLGQPWSRIVLMKGFDASGFIFYTGLASRKAQDIESHPAVSLHFPWLAMDRQVIVSGAASQVDRASSERYFHSRPRESQIATWVATQSEEIASRETLDRRYEVLLAEFEGRQIPMPNNWGGYRVKPDTWEFWQGGEHRLHDRFRYTPVGNRWEIARLAP